MTGLAEMVTAMAKHLPPSASRLRLWDIGGSAGESFGGLRDDIETVSQSTDPNQWPDGDDLVDSIAALDTPEMMGELFLEKALGALRPGGRLIMVRSNGQPSKKAVTALENAGFMRILVENIDSGGVLMRGEKPHRTASTFARVKVAADADADNVTLTDFKGPYVFVLVRQTPNKPVWKLGPDEKIGWEAVTTVADDYVQIAAFTSLPKAVSLMQTAVIQGVVRDVNKVGKFRREVALGWDMPVILNPTLDVLKARTVDSVTLDPDTAEAPDE
ncbi:MAG: hypothetical protein AAF125_08040 [Chloroflexota bacterium]